MVNLKRGKNLLNSAKTLFNQNDLAGVTGLAYQAIENAIIALHKIKGDFVRPYHKKRINYISKLIKTSEDILIELWEARNIDFYGNVKFEEKQKILTKEEIKKHLETSQEIFKKTEELFYDIIEKEIKEIIQENPKTSLNALMGILMPKFKGKLEGKRLVEIIKKYT